MTISIIQLSHFSSFIAVIAAVYISMCIDDVLKGIWTTRYYEDLQGAMRKYYLESHDDFISRIVEKNREKAFSIAVYMKNRAIYFFVLCLILLYLSGYENCNDADRYSFIHMSMLLLVLWSLVLLLFNRYFFVSKGHTAIGTILVALVTLVSSAVNAKWIGICVPSALIIHIVLLFLVFPIIWQVFVCWTYSGPYRDYITYKLAKGKLNYEQTEYCLNNHDYDHLPRHYKDLYARKSIESSDAEEAKRTCLDDYLEQMEEAISRASDSRYAFMIFLFWVYYSLRGYIGRLSIRLHIKKVKTISQQ